MATKLLENSLSLQALIEGLTPSQILARDNVMRLVAFSSGLATALVKGEISPEEAVAIHRCSVAIDNSEALLAKLASAFDQRFGIDSNPPTTQTNVVE